MNFNAGLLAHGAEHLGCFGVFSGQDLRQHFNNRHRHVHLVHDLGKFHADNAAADNEHALGQLLKIQGFIGGNAVGQCRRSARARARNR